MYPYIRYSLIVNRCLGNRWGAVAECFADKLADYLKADQIKAKRIEAPIATEVLINESVMRKCDRIRILVECEKRYS